MNSINHSSFPDPSLAAATAALRRKGLDPGKHDQLAHNLAYAFDGLAPETVDFLVEHSADWGGPNAPSEESIPCPERTGRKTFWKDRTLGKALRDLKSPYTDHDVKLRLEETARDAETLMASTPGLSDHVYAIGSLHKGRFGAGSDLDLLFVSVDPLPVDKASVPSSLQLLRTLEGRLETALDWAGAHTALTQGKVLEQLTDSWHHHLEHAGLKDSGGEIERVAERPQVCELASTSETDTGLVSPF